MRWFLLFLFVLCLVHVVSVDVVAQNQAALTPLTAEERLIKEVLKVHLRIDALVERVTDLEKRLPKDKTAKLWPPGPSHAEIQALLGETLMLAGHTKEHACGCGDQCNCGKATRTVVRVRSTCGRLGGRLLRSISVPFRLLSLGCGC